MRRASVFLVEDEAIVRMMLAQLVEELGHRVAAEAGNIRDAGEYTMTCTFDVAILDINIGGFRVGPVADVIEQRGLPLLFVTDYGKTWLPSLFRKHPVLEKPVSSERLRDVIESLLR